MRIFLLLLFQSLGICLFGSCSEKEVDGMIERVSASTFAQWISNGQVVIIDVRTPAEFALGHLPGAININVSDNSFSSQLQAISPNKQLALYCQGGGRSANAAKIAAGLGYMGKELDGGIKGWTGAKVTNDQTLSGEIYLQNETFYFKPQGSNLIYLLADKTGKLNQWYNENVVTETNKTTPITIVVTEKTKSLDNTSTQYDGIFEVWRIS